MGAEFLVKDAADAWALSAPSLWHDVYVRALQDCGLGDVHLFLAEDAATGKLGFRVSTIVRPEKIALVVGKAGPGKKYQDVLRRVKARGPSLEVAAEGLARACKVLQPYRAALVLRTLEFMGSV